MFPAPFSLLASCHASRQCCSVREAGGGDESGVGAGRGGGKARALGVEEQGEESEQPR